ncbi:MAG: hypothetical protein ACYDH9_00260 [Limisphaerales bacterium]
MTVVRIKRWRVLAVALASGQLVGWQSESVFAGDTITFSGQKGKVDLPSANAKNQEPFKPFDFLERKGSGKSSAEIPQTPSLSPGTISSKRMLELEKQRDQQKNWIFLTSDDLNTTTTPEEAFGVEDYSVDGQSKRPRKAIERYWDSMGRDSQSKSNRSAEASSSDGSSDKLDDNLNLRTPSLLDSSFRNSPAKTAEHGGSPLIDQLRSADALTHSLGDLSGNRSFSPESSLLSASPAGGNERLDAARLQARDDDFKKMILPPEPGSPLSGLRDPINSPLDQTRQAFHPVTAGSTADSAFSKGPLDQLPSLNNLGRSGPASGLDFLSSRAVGPSSLSPAVVAPTDSPWVSSRPAVLDIPRRRF